LKNISKNTLLFFILACFFQAQNSFAQSSVLAKGDWIKIGVQTSGVYKLDANFLQKAGLNLSQINPQNIKIYGNGGAMLPQANDVPRTKDLIENNIFVEGETDGRFDNQDFILFYGQSPHQISYDSLSKSFRHQFNIYSDTTFYFLTVSDTKGLRIKDQNSVAATAEITTFDDYVFHEIDTKNILAQAPFAGSGRLWMGEEFASNSEKIIPFNLSGFAPNSKLSITASVGASAFRRTQFLVKANGQNVGSIPLYAIGTDTYADKANLNNQFFTINSDNFTNATDLKIGLTFDRDTLKSGAGYLDFLGVQSVRNLKLYGNQTHFRSLESLKNNFSKFILNESNQSLKIWDISNPPQAQNQLYQLQNQKINFGIDTKKLKEFIVFDNVNFLNPISFQKIKNQNLRSAEVPDLLIVASDILRKQANRLADFRRENDKLSVLVVSPQEIYHEFSSGKQDITAIRDFAKFLYERNPLKFKYLLLFGDASYDYKKRLNVVSSETQSIIIPTYESRESVNPIYSFSSDDYFGFMSNNEGHWSENDNSNHTLEVGIGRLPVKNIQEAEQVVNKLIHYGTNKNTLGDWRSRVAFVADNGDGNIHQDDAENFSKIMSRQTADYQSDKIYIDAFPLISLPDRQSIPQANQRINQAFQKGSLIVNYNGHGNETGWTDEKILTTGDILGFTNYNTMPLMLTATCQFGRFDDPYQVSGAELSLLNSKGGAIALLTTTRPVYQYTNYLLNEAFYKAVFKPINGKMPRLGDVIIDTKNNSLKGVLNRNFSLLGDPSMRLNYPENEVVISKINGKEITKSDTLKALSKVVLQGEIRDLGGSNKVNTFNGTAQITIFDKPKNLQTLGNKGSKFAYQDYQNILFEGQVKVQSGGFTCTFVVPKDINYQYGEGKIFVYAQTTDATSDASGSSKVVVGGSNNQSIADNQAPKIDVYLNDENFRDGGETNDSPIFIAKLSDESGLNTATDGLGHEMLLTIDDTTKVIVNQYFTSKLDDYRSGEIHYPLRNLKEGEHQLKLKVWDTHNNSSENSLRFRVVISRENLLTNVFCYPNPTSQITHFSFEHERVGDDLEISIEIYDNYGRTIKLINENAYKITSPYDQILWNISEDSSPIVTGNYFYRIFAKSLTTNYQATGTGRIASVK
jgi:hypothetical protein